MNSPMNDPIPASNEQVVVFPPERGIGVLAVARPYPPGYKLQKDGALGINIAMVNGDRDGLLVYILAYLDMAVGDNIKVYIETKNAPVAEFSVTDAHFYADGNAKNLPFYISANDMEARFLPRVVPQNKDFWFEVQRVSGNSEASPPAPLFYKHPTPGEADIDGGKPFNQGLKLPIASESLVDQTVINKGMFVTVEAYFNQAIGDVVVLAFGSLTRESTVSALGDVVFELTPYMLATLAPTNSLLVRWEVFDVVENASGWSDALTLDFKPGEVLLTAPIFEQADLENVVNHDGLAGGAMNVLVTGTFTINDLIELTLEGLTKSGAPVTHTYSQTLTAAGRTVGFPVENERVRNLIGGSLHASYKLIRASKTQNSKPADVTITGTSQPLGLPIVEPLVDNKLPVDTAIATVRVADYWPLKTGANVKVHWQTTDQGGVATLFIFQLIVTDPTQPVIFQVPAKYIAPYASTPLTVQCTVTNPGEVQVFSQLLQLTFGEEAKIELLPPFLVKPAVSPVDPLGDPVTVRVEYLEALDGDRARLVEVNPPAGSPQFPLVAFNSNKRTNTVLSPAFLAARQGKDIELRWNLNRNNAQIGKSPVLKLSVLKIADGDARFPTPVIAGRTGQALDVSELAATDVLTVAQWLGQEVGQFVWLRYEGTDKNGVATEIVVFSGTAHSSASGLSAPVPLEWLGELQNDSSVKITLKVNFDRVSNESTAVSFPVRTYTVKTVEDAKPVITSAKDSESFEIANGASTIDTSITFSGTASKDQQVEVFDGETSKGIATANSSGDWTHTVTGLSLAIHSFTAKAQYGSGQVSPVWTVTVVKELVRDFTDFNENLYNGWAAGPSVHSHDLTIRPSMYESNSFVLFNNTFSNKSSGVILTKTFSNLRPEREYIFTVRGRRANTAFEAPVLFLSTSQGDFSLDTPLSDTKWSFPTLQFTAKSNTVKCDIQNRESSGKGNDYELDDITVTAL